MPINYYSYSHESARLTMRPLTLDYANDWDDFMNSNEATALFPEYLKPPVYTAKVWIERQIARYQNDQLGLLALVEKKSGKFVGMCGLLKQTLNGQPEIEVGYHLLPKFWKHGYAREAANYFMKFAFTAYKLDSIISLIHPENKASQRVAIANGLQTDHKEVDNHGPSNVYRITREEWLKLQD